MWHVLNVFLSGCRLYLTRVRSVTDFSQLRVGIRLLVFNAHLTGSVQVCMLESAVYYVSIGSVFVCQRLITK